MATLAFNELMQDKLKAITETSNPKTAKILLVKHNTNEKTEVRILTTYPLADCGYVGKVWQMLHCVDLIIVHDEHGCTKLLHSASNSKTVTTKILHTNEYQQKNDGWSPK